MEAHMSAPVFIASCSPRKGGNCDFAAALVARTLPVASSVVRVADSCVRPCNACGVCDSCRLRKEGFLAAKVADPTRYR